MSPISLIPLPDDVAARVAEANATQVNLYRALAHSPGLLRAWVDFAWALRGADATPRRLRELIILRTALLHRSPYEWHQHRIMARDAGVTEYDVAELGMWPTSDAYSDAERAALALTDAVVADQVPESVLEEFSIHFDERQRVELIVTAGYYSMVPRILEALDVPIETAPHGDG